MAAPIKRVGCLTRVNQILVDDATSPVFTLQHWSAAGQTPPSGAPPSARRHRSSRYAPALAHRTHARELLLKTQEAALNFLVRWCLLDGSYSRQSIRLEARQVGSAAATSQPEGARGVELTAGGKRAVHLSQLIARHQGQLTRTRSTTRSRLLLEDVQKLRKRNLATLMRYVFWRWLTWVNAIELLLILLLAALCAYQCFELLEDYYNYPTHVIVTNVLNDDFRTDLPALTLCDNNRISRARLKADFPELNETHYLAMSHGRFYSVHNFSLVHASAIDSAHPDGGFGGDEDVQNSTWHSLAQKAEALRTSALEAKLHAGVGHYHNSSSGGDLVERVWHPLNENDINWVKVAQTLTNFSPAGHFAIVPRDSFVDSLICATISGDQIPCDKLKAITSIQKAAICRTFFHDSVLWDASEPSVADLERQLSRKPIRMTFGKAKSIDANALLEFEPELELRELLEEEADERANEERIRIEMDNMEIIRMRVNFRGSDYANLRELVGGRLAVHSSSTIGEISHKSYFIEPGNWYIYYIERSDHHRLPPPYSTNCFDYDSNRYVWRERRRAMGANAARNKQLIERQTNSTQRLLPEYVEFLRARTMGKRECIKMCLSELSSSKCGCWNQGVPFVHGHDGGDGAHTLDASGSMSWCRLQRIVELQRELNMSTKTTGDDLFFHTCSAAYTPMCVAACPDECFYSSFEVIQQSRSWPSHESQRYSEDRRIWRRLRHEAECCATISIIYTSPASTSLMTEPKYTRQDMVTIISGNIEAWLGVSAVHAYLFFEHLYAALASWLRRA